VLQFKDIQQNSDEWDNLRVGRITSSSLNKVMANLDGPFGDPAKRYAIDIALGQITGKAPANGYTNKDMARGHEQEPLARMEYEKQTFSIVKNGGFFFDDDLGCSPDGLVGDDGVIEIKSAIPSVHFERVRKQTFDPAYKWQLIGNMKLPNKDWIDFISYCPDFPEGKRNYVVRLKAANYKREFEMIDTRLDQFRALIKKTKETILNSNYCIEVTA
jgi:hypothetical protein